jgi:hypothetical protein
MSLIADPVPRGDLPYWIDPPHTHLAGTLDFQSRTAYTR